jgi:hypothetical protein
MRLAFALLLTAHAIAHLPGFLVSWRLMDGQRDLQYRTTIFGGAVDVGRVGIRIIGLLWLLAGFGVAYAAIQFFKWTDLAWPAAWAATAFSTIMTLVGWPDSKVGAVMNGVVFAALTWFLLAGS